jgi:hypothetical protein
MDYAYMKAIEGPIVDGVGLGYPGFFALPGQVSIKKQQIGWCCAVQRYCSCWCTARLGET